MMRNIFNDFREWEYDRRRYLGARYPDVWYAILCQKVAKLGKPNAMLEGDAVGEISADIVHTLTAICELHGRRIEDYIKQLHDEMEKERDE